MTKFDVYIKGVKELIKKVEKAVDKGSISIPDKAQLSIDLLHAFNNDILDVFEEYNTILNDLPEDELLDIENTVPEGAEEPITDASDTGENTIDKEIEGIKTLTMEQIRKRYLKTKANDTGFSTVDIWQKVTGKDYNQLKPKPSETVLATEIFNLLNKTK